MPRPVQGAAVLYNSGNSPYWHPAKVMLTSEVENSVELAVYMVEGRDQYDLGGSSIALQIKAPCWHEDDPRINSGDELWKTIIGGQVGGKWKFDPHVASYIEDIEYLGKQIASLEKRLAKVDKFLLELGHVDTQGNQPGPEPKPAKAKSTKTPLADSDNAEE